MKHFITGVMGFLFTTILQASGITAGTWQFWAVFASVLVIIAVQYMDR